jgi:RNA polymerase sigma-70 factor, ECF subfamily
MTGLDVWLKSGGSGPELLATRFQPSPMYEGAGQERRADRGKPAGDADPRAQGFFPWTSAVKALAMFLLLWAAWARRRQQDGSASKPVFQGMRGSPASSLNDALTKKNAWLAGIFGSDEDGDPLALQLLRRINPDLKRGGEPVSLSLNTQMLPPEKITVFLDGAPVEDPAELERLAREVRAQWAARSTSRPPSRGAGRPPAPVSSAGVAGSAGPSSPGKHAGPATVTARYEIGILKVDRPFHDYSREELDRLLERIRSLLESSRDDLLISTREGCVEVILRLTPGEAERLLALAEAGVLDDFAVIGARVVSSPEERGTLLNGLRPTPPRRAEEHFAAPARPNPELTSPLSALAPQSDQEAAWEAIDRVYRPRVFRLARRILGAGHREEAENITQDVLFRAFRSRHTWARERPFWPWLSAILRRGIRQGRRPVHHSLEAEGLDVLDSAPSPPDRLVSGEFTERFRDALLALPPGMRELLVARHYRGQTLAQIGEATSVVPSTVSVRLARAKAAFCAALGDLRVSDAEFQALLDTGALGAAFRSVAGDEE